MMSTKEPLMEALRAYGVTDGELLQQISRHSCLRDFAAESSLIPMGEMPDSFYLIESGLVRYYYTSTEGKERNKTFFREGQFTGSLSSLLLRQACPYTVATVEPCKIYVMPLNLMRTDSLHPQLDAMLKQLTAEMFLRNEAREALLLTCNAEQRYRWLLDNEEWMLTRIPQYHLASYLGMDAVSLSRIKKKLQQA